MGVNALVQVLILKSVPSGQGGERNSVSGRGWRVWPRVCARKGMCDSGCGYVCCHGDVQVCLPDVKGTLFQSGLPTLLSHQVSVPLLAIPLVMVSCAGLCWQQVHDLCTLTLSTTRETAGLYCLPPIRAGMGTINTVMDLMSTQMFQYNV